MQAHRSFDKDPANLFNRRQEPGATPPPSDGPDPSLERGWGPTGSGLGAADAFAGLFDGPTVQREASGNGVAEALAPDQLIPSGGRALEPVVQRKMESALGGDLSGVRIHTDDGRAKAMGAEAYTVGSDIVFKSGNYDPDSEGGQRRLAHELTHVLQQRAGAVSGEDLGNGTAVSDPSDAFERQAEDAADRVMGGAAPAAAMFSGGGASAGASVQRVVQREASEGESSWWDYAAKGAKKLLKKGLGKAAGPVVDSGNSLRKVLSEPANSVERSQAAEQAIRDNVPIVGDKAADYLRKKFPWQSEVGEGSEGVSGDVTGGNPHTGTVPDAEGNLDNGDGTVTTTNGDIVDKATGKSRNAGDNELTEARKKELDDARNEQPQNDNAE